MLDLIYKSARYSALLIFTVANSAFAATYYVDGVGGDGLTEGGHNTNNGTSIATPFLTLSKVNAKVAAGDTVMMRGGTYAEQIKPGVSGKANAKITYTRYQNETVEIDLGEKLKGWRLYSGTEGVDAIYTISTTNIRGKKCAGQMTENTYETSGKYASYFNKKVTNRQVKDEINVITQKAEFYCISGVYYARTIDSTSPDKHDVRISFGIGIDLTDKNYITVDGVNVRNVSKYISSQNSVGNTVTNGSFLFANGWACVNLRNATKTKITNNQFKGCNSVNAHNGDLFQLVNSSYNMIEKNDISYATHGGIRLRTNSSKNIIRENFIHDSYGKHVQIDKGSDNNIVEYNHFTGSPNKEDLLRAHFSDHSVLEIGSQNNIVRFNKFWDNSYAIRLNAYQSSTVPAKNTVIYNNTIIYSHTHKSVNFGAGLMMEIWKNFPVIEETKIVNNIFYNSTSGESDTGVTQIGWQKNQVLGNLVSRLEGNIISSDVSTNNVIAGQYSVAQFESAYPRYINNIQDNPGLLRSNISNPDFNLTHNSAARDAGVYLTKTTRSGIESSTINVIDASYFIDGFGVTQGDTIQVGSQTVVITTVDYGANSLTVDRSISWSVGESVSFPYSGTLPDIGAYEYKESNSPPVARDDNAATEQNTEVFIDVLANDSDPDGGDSDSLNVSAVTQGSAGTVTNYGTNVAYMPNIGFSGPDRFTYTVSDGNNSFDTATVSVTVKSSTISTIVLDPIADTFVQSGANSKRRFGGKNQLRLKRSGGDWGRESFLKFDLTEQSGTIISAKLVLHVVKDDDNNTEVLHNVSFVADDSWAENSLSWNSKPVIDTRLSQLSITGLGVYEFDVSAVIQSELGDLFSLSVTSENGAPRWIGYASKEHTTITLRPTLKITYE